MGQRNGRKIHIVSIHKYIFLENIKELESLIKKKFQNGLKSKFGHSNFLFSVKNIKINKFKRINVSAIFDERKIECMKKCLKKGAAGSPFCCRALWFTSTDCRGPSSGTC